MMSDNSMEEIIIGDINNEKRVKLEAQQGDSASESQEVITDNQEYYEIMLVGDGSENPIKIVPKISHPQLTILPDTESIQKVTTVSSKNLQIDPALPKANIVRTIPFTQPRIIKKYVGKRKVDPYQRTEPIKILPKPSNLTNGSTPQAPAVKKQLGRRKTEPPPPRMEPVKILPKLTTLSNGSPKILQYIESPNPESTRSEQIDKLIEKMLKENTNEIDVFFRSMAASVKKLQPYLIPKVKMEVCNVIAKYEMQSFDNQGK